MLVLSILFLFLFLLYSFSTHTSKVNAKIVYNFHPLIKSVFAVAVYKGRA